MMYGTQEESEEKKRILKDLARCLRVVYIQSSSSVHDSVLLNLNSPLIQCVDRSLQHGLLNLMGSYWPLVKGYSHAQTLQTINNWVGSQGSPRTKGQAWLLATLIEGSLQSYLHCILAEPQSLNHHYAPHAILRDPSYVTQLSSLLTGLESVNFSVMTNADFNSESRSDHCSEEGNTSTYVKKFLKLALDGGPTLSATTMTSSMTSSLISPVDSGFTQLDSETDTTSFSEMILDPDSSSIKEDIAVLPVDSCTEKSCRSFKSTLLIEPMTTSDIVNANTSLDPLCMKSHTQRELGNNVVSSSSSYNDYDSIVLRKSETQAGKAPLVKQQKRVSFHEGMSLISHEENCLSQGSNPVISNAVNALSPASNPRAVEDGLDVVEFGTDSSHTCYRCMEPLFVKNLVHMSADHYHNCAKAPVAERGIPEGQEDPACRCPTSSGDLSRVSFISDCPGVIAPMSHNSSPAPSCSSLRPQVSTPTRILYGSKSSLTGMPNSCVANVLSQTPSKACLVNRFLRSLTEKKINNCRAAAALAIVNKWNSSIRRHNLYITGVKPSAKLSQELLDELREEMNLCVRSPISGVSHQSCLSVDITSTYDALLEFLPDESIVKVFKVRGTALDDTGQRTPLVVVLTNHALYIINCKLQVQSSLQYTQLSYILVGANLQWISLIPEKKSLQINLLTGECDCTSAVISTIELGLRRRGRKLWELPGVICLTLDDLAIIPSWKPIIQNEKIHHYSVVHAVEMPTSLVSPSESCLEAHFMFRTCKNNIFGSWEPGFFLLKSGALYVFSDEVQVLPSYVVNVSGLNCRLVSLASRPHIIEVDFLQIAAPDNNVAHQWLDSLKRPSPEVLDASPSCLKFNVVSGALVLAGTRLVLINSLSIPSEPMEKSVKLLLTAFVTDVTSVKFGDTDSSWCVVEFSCREVHESGGDYIIFFSTSQQMLAFKNALSMLNPTLEKNSSILPSSGPLHRHCSKISASLNAGWNFSLLK